MEYKNYYETLGVDKTASSDEIKRSYRKLAKQYHPDANPGDKKSEEIFKNINEAYEVLGDEEKRKKYDKLGSSFDFNNGYDFDPSEYGFNASKSRYDYKDSTSPFSDFFYTFFGNNSINLDDILGGLGFGKQNTNSGFNQKSYTENQFDRRRSVFYDASDIETEMIITLEEAFVGTEKKIALQQADGKNKNFLVNIPAGIRNGEKIRLAGLGHLSQNGDTGDLFVKIKIKEHKKFKLEGSDVYIELPLSPWEAAFGAQVKVQAIDGMISIKIPAGIQSGQKLRITGKGYHSAGGGRGDLYTEVLIMIPKELSDEERELFMELQSISKFNPRK